LSDVALVHCISRPFFHLDLVNAVQSAVANAEKKANGPMAPKNIVTVHEDVAE
jgi:hypothetical protein